MVLNCHGLEGDLLGVLKVGIRPPDEVKPLDGQQPVLPSHVFGQNQSVVIPRLSKKHVGRVSLEEMMQSCY